MDVASWVAVVGPITTLLSGLGGYWLAGRNDDARDKRAAAREVATRQAALAERLEEDRHTFQRDTLLELQDNLEKLAQLTVKAILRHHENIRTGEKLNRLPPGLSDEHFQTRVSAQRLATRLLNPSLRQAVGEFIILCLEYSYLLGTESAPRETVLGKLEGGPARIGVGSTEVQELLGEYLRRELDRRYLAELPQDVASQGGQP